MGSTIGLLYDMHVVAGDRDEYDGVPTVERAIDKLNDVGIDWTVVGGDIRHLLAPANEHNDGITDWGNWHGDPDNYYYRDDFERAKVLLDDRLDCEYVVARGNNDRPVDVYREFFPAEEFPLWGWFEDDGVRYVVLDSNPHQAHHSLTETQNFVSAPQLSMLERLVDRDPSIPTFVFVHAPLAKHTELTDNWETGHNAAYFLTLNHRSVQAILERGNTVLVNSGHYHPDDGRGCRFVNGVGYVVARHLVHNLDPGYGGDVRWMDVDPEARSATVDYYDLGADEEGTIVRTEWD